MATEIACAACKKERRQVNQLVALHLGTDNQVSYICDECISLFAEIVAEKKPDWARKLVRRLEKGPLKRGH
jgi:ATP-dependent protease Clp ATPase subunit